MVLKTKSILFDQLKICVVVLLSTICFDLYSQNLPCVFKHYSTQDGLSHSGVMCILEDHTGIMWFGTWDGLNKFDGYTFTNYKSNPGDLSSLSHNRIDFIMEDRFGFIWVKTYDEKIHRFDPATEKFLNVFAANNNKKQQDLHFEKIIETQTGEIWLVSKTSGCFRVITDTSDYLPQIYQYSNSQNDLFAIPDNQIKFIYQDSKFNTWISTAKGIKTINNAHELKLPNELLKPNGFYYSAFAESDNFLWLGTTNGNLVGINILNENLIQKSLPGKAHVTTINNLDSCHLLVGTKNQGLFVFNKRDKNYMRFDKNKILNLPSNNIESVFIDKFGLAWIETNMQGVVRFNHETNSFKWFTQKTDNVSPYVYYGDYYKIFEDINGRLWINLKKGGFCYYNRIGDEIEYFYNEPGSKNRRFSNLVTDAISDSYGNLWLSTHSRGIEKASFIHNQFKHFSPNSNSLALSANEVRAIFEDNNQFLWVATKEGKLYCYKNNELRKVFSKSTTGIGEINFNGMVYCITQDSNGALWFGTKGDGIVKASYLGDPSNLRFKTSHFKFHENQNNGLSNNFVYTILEDNKKRIWIGTYGGGLNLMTYKKGSYEIKNFMNSFFNYPFSECNQIRHLQEDSAGKIWIGTTNGLIVFNPENQIPDSLDFYLFQKEPGNIKGLANNDVHYIFRDNSDNFWVSTFGGGLGKVTHQNNTSIKFTNYTTQNGLPIDIVLSILQDNLGNLWLSTENGLSKFDPEHNIFYNYSKLDGIKSLIFSEAACCKSRNGELYFGGMDGYYSFFPNKIVTENITPKLILANLQLFNKNIKVNDENSILEKSITFENAITLKHWQSVFSIEYAGIYFRNPDKVEYAFMLEGFENNWNYVRNQRKATYTNLPPGEYVFKVKCTTSGKFTENSGRELKIKILPPWYKTFWAFLGYFILLSVAGFISWKIFRQIIRLKNKVIIEQKITDLKLKFFTNISHELRTPLTLIKGPTEELLKMETLPTKSKEYLGVIHKNANRMLSHINNLLDFRKMQTGKMRLKISEIEMVSFLKNIYLGFTELANSRKINFHFNTNTQALHAWIDIEKIDTVIFNLLSNAFKFTPEGKRIDLTLNLLKPEGLFQIIVKDQGIGIAQENIPFIFERFTSFGKQGFYKNKGSGIGLSLTLEIIEMHKGTINVKSKPGEGSTFLTNLKLGKDHYKKTDVDFKEVALDKPVHQNITDGIDSKTKTVIAKKENNGQVLPTILLVEDNEDLRDYLSIKLQEQYNIIEAIDGLDGWQKAQKHTPDLIISDIMMPGVDGIKLVDMLRHELLTSHIPIILLSAKSSLENIMEGLKYGANAYIAKPFNMDYLMIRIANLLEQNKRLLDKYSRQHKVVELTPDEIVVTDRDEELIKKVIKTIEENIGNPELNVEKIAHEIGLGRTTFFKKIKGLTGMSPIEFIRDMKIKRGHQLLKTGEYNISETAFMLGFSDAGYFTKCFKEKYNTTPSEVLKANKKENG